MARYAPPGVCAETIPIEAQTSFASLSDQKGEVRTMADRTDRRRFLQASLLGTAGAGAFVSLEEQILGAAVTGDTPQSEPQSPYQGDPLPTGRLGKLTIGRLVLGGNLIGGYAHSRDLLYVSSLLRAYNTEAKIFETLNLAERSGITMIQVSPGSSEVVAKYNGQGGRIQMMVCIHPNADESKVRDEIQLMLDRGAVALYTHGEVSDRCVRGNDLKTLARSIELIQRAGVPAGVGSHSLETTIASETHDLGPDYYVKTFHPDTYWSATPKESREEWCWYGPRSQDHDGYHDNIFCLDPERTVEVLRSVTKPWFAFKVMAAGAINPQIGFNHAFQNGADFVIAGMFDFQIAKDVEIAVKALKRAQNRERPWCS
jgi:hypothetical protein